MGKEIEKKMNNEMETELTWWIIGVWVPTSTTSDNPKPYTLTLHPNPKP